MPEPVTISILGLLNEYIFSGVPSNAVWDLIKGAWEKANERNWEELYLDAFQAAVEQQQIHLKQYAAPDGEISLDRAALSKALHADLHTHVDQLSPSQLSDDKFIALLAEALSACQGLIIGGHVIGDCDYHQLVRNLVQQATFVFKQSIKTHTPAFRQAMLAEAHSNYDLLQEIQDYLLDRFDLVIVKLESIDETINRVDSRTRCMDTKLDGLLLQLPLNKGEVPKLGVLNVLRNTSDKLDSILGQLRGLSPPYVPADFTQIRQDLDSISDTLRRLKRSRQPLSVRARISSLVDSVGSSEAANLVNLRIGALELESVLAHAHGEKQIASLVGRMQSKVEAVVDEVDHIAKMLE